MATRQRYNLDLLPKRRYIERTVKESDIQIKSETGSFCSPSPSSSVVDGQKWDRDRERDRSKLSEAPELELRA
ncbi:hypothetical protein EVAR_5973_1 [Eumeta japonica]|uniref:Uncharacterized protein n=1 Tax=Eumeta variegata TaxID=151549 RepID=A0A4C1TCU8_EUMVA|nr:hypothetical protein EVAR_5973_1 [Eumeta japonica]